MIGTAAAVGLLCSLSVLFSRTARTRLLAWPGGGVPPAGRGRAGVATDHVMSNESSAMGTPPEVDASSHVPD